MEIVKNETNMTVEGASELRGAANRNLEGC